MHSPPVVAAQRERRRAAAGFALAAIATVACATLVLATSTAILLSLPGRHVGTIDLPPPHVWIAFAVAVLALVAGAAAREAVRLSDGGPGLARLLGARPVAADSVDPGEQRLRAIAHEASVLAGAAMPALYVLDDEDGINACAAGHDARDAAVIVTHGALARLARDELEGVFAHEYAHVLRGDAGLDLRLVAWSAGLMFVADFGRALRSWARPEQSAGRGRIRGGPVAKLVFVAGTAFVALGAPGWLAGRLLQRAAGRSREFEADAAAVRFVGKPLGLGNALRKAEALGASGEARLQNPAASITAHAWLLSPSRRPGWLSSHPPTADRVLKIFGRAMPAWVDEPDACDDGARDARTGADGSTAAFVPTGVEAGRGRGRWTASRRRAADGAQALIRRWPIQWHTAAAAVRRAPGARAVALALLSPGRAESVALQGARGDRAFEPGALPVEARQALVELAAGTLRHEPALARKDLLRRARKLIESDPTVTLLEFVLYVTLADRLGNRLRTTRRHARVRRDEASMPLGLIVRAAFAWPGSDQPASLRSLKEAMARAERVWGSTPWWPPGDIPPGEVVAAIRTIGALRPPERHLAVEALDAAFSGARDPDPLHQSLLRTLCHAWGVPRFERLHADEGLAARELEDSPIMRA